MPIFTVQNEIAKQLKKSNFSDEKRLQSFVENNLEELLGIVFIESDYSTSIQQGGRIDTLGIDENGSPVIIEYKCGDDSVTMNQGLYYLDWLVDNQEEFRLLSKKKLGTDLNINFGTPRLVLIVQNFSNYDLYAISRMSENIELWSYNFYEEGSIISFTRVTSSQAQNEDNTKSKFTKVPYNIYPLNKHIEGYDSVIVDLFQKLRSSILSLSNENSIEEISRKEYILYRTNRNIAQIKLTTYGIVVHINLDIKQIKDPKNMCQVNQTTDFYGIGETELILNSIEDLEYVVKIINQSYIQYS